MFWGAASVAAEVIGERTCWRCGFVAVSAIERCPADGTALVYAAVGEHDDPLVGQVVGDRYRVMRRIAQGGVASVYLACTREGQVVAVKVLKPALKDVPAVRRRFVDEARLLLGLRHPNVVQVFDFGQLSDGNLFMVMEHLPGETLHARLEREVLSYAQVLDILDGLCAALAYVHAAGVVHRDLKPSNVMLLDGERPKLIDFGVAGGLHAPLQEEVEGEHAVGTPMYMAPEQLLGQPAAAAMDMYALGTLAFLMLSDRLPFAEGRREQRRKLAGSGAQALRTIPGLEDVPIVLDTLVDTMLRREPGARPLSMQQIRRALAFARREMPVAMLSQRPASAAPAPAYTPSAADLGYGWSGLWERVRARPVWLAAAATATAVGVWVSIL